MFLFLFYFDCASTLYINLDTSKVFGFNIIIYYISGYIEDSKYSK